MAAARPAQARIEALEADGAVTVCRDGALTGFGVRVRKNHVLLTRARGARQVALVHHRPARPHQPGRGNGRVERDGNRAENRFAPLALTKKNALLASHDEGGSARDRMASLIEIALVNGIEPFAWLEATLEAIAPRHSNNRMPRAFNPSSTCHSRGVLDTMGDRTDRTTAHCNA